MRTMLSEKLSPIPSRVLPQVTLLGLWILILIVQMNDPGMAAACPPGEHPCPIYGCCPDQTVVDPPSLYRINPNSGQPGQVIEPLVLEGSDFMGVVDVQINTSAIQVSNVRRISASRMEATFSLAATVPSGIYQVWVTARGGTSNRVNFTVGTPSDRLTIQCKRSGESQWQVRCQLRPAVSYDFKFTVGSPVACRSKIFLTKIGEDALASPAEVNPLRAMDPSGPDACRASIFENTTVMPSLSGLPSGVPWKYEVRTDAGSTLAEETIIFDITTEAGGCPTPAGAPTITAVTTPIPPDVIRNEQVTDITLTGTNLCESTLRIATESYRTGDPPRYFPTASIRSVNPEGTEMLVQVEASDPAILDYHTLVVANAYGQDTKPFRVIPRARPIWDVMTPADPRPGRSYILHIQGWNLSGATVIPEDPGRLIVSSQQNSDNEISGILEIRGGATAGPTRLFLQDGDVSCTPPYYYYCSIPITITPGSGALDDTALNVTAQMNDPDIPPLYLSQSGAFNGFQINERLRAAMQPNDPDPTAGFICGFTRRLFSLNLQRNFVFCRGAGTYTLECTRGLQVGNAVGLGAFVLSVFFEVDIGLHWRCWPPSWPALCLKVVLGVEIPGSYGPVGLAYDSCFFNPERLDPRLGRTDRLDFYSGEDGCFGIRDQWWGAPGLKYADLTMTDCCSEPIRLTSSGRSGEHTRFAQNFNTDVVTCQGYLPLSSCGVSSRDDCSQYILAKGATSRIVHPIYGTAHSRDEVLDLFYNVNVDKGVNNVWTRPRNGDYDGGCKIWFNTSGNDRDYTPPPDVLPPNGEPITLDITERLMRRDPNYRPDRVTLYFTKGPIRVRGTDLEVGGDTPRGFNGALVVDGPPIYNRTYPHEVGHILGHRGEVTPTGPPNHWSRRNLMTQSRFTSDVQLTTNQCVVTRRTAKLRYQDVP